MKCEETNCENEFLFNTGMPSSGTMIVASIKKLGFKPEDIKLIINGHAHSDHAEAWVWRLCNERPKVSDPAHRTCGLQPERDGRVRCSMV